MNIIHFVALVDQMRKSQKKYLRFKQLEDLKDCINLETLVDKAINEGKFFLPQERVTSISNPVEEN